MSRCWLIHLLLLLGCKSLAPASGLDDAAAHSRIMDGHIHGATVLVDAPANASDATLVAEVKKQLRYAIGNLNEFQHGTDLSRSQVQITGRSPTGGGLAVVYDATLLIAWANSGGSPDGGFSLVLPASVVDSSFYTTFSPVCVEAGASHLSEDHYWYYYRTLPEVCRQRMAGSTQVTRVPVTLSPSPTETFDRMPEYDLIWQDQTLTATYVFGRANSGEAAGDAGIAVFNQMADWLDATTGTSATRQNGFVDGYSGPFFAQWRFQLNHLNFDIAIWLVPGELLDLDPQNAAWYRGRVASSDLVVYSGHSGLGSNLQKLVDLGLFKNGQYQLLVVNACDSYSFDYDALKRAAAAANPGSSRYFDAITNATPALFESFLKGAQAALGPFLDYARNGSKASFVQLLAGFDEAQHAVVRYEGDNPSAILLAPTNP